MQNLENAEALTASQPVAGGAGDAGAGKLAVSAGGILGALAAASCCILPLALVGLGASGAWIGRLGSLAPYQPIFLGFTAVCLGVGFYLVYRKPKVAGVVPGAVCARPVSHRVTKILLWCATGIAVAALAFPFVLALFD